ncbi:hypothetical protein K402DRAFT_343737 [Aulographum hederae CBS 113979]|uniref:P-loop containing nucleoside triphosphate hydrolase protein n=1 Tax=Aulographum hederae CBS 113979 TaxID=1176131 RepID=A0A6G1GIW3_9PEZI|nr:hypothetical protein K402DRAFT_343737 [Aulographum hederae CBS 113979]
MTQSEDYYGDIANQYFQQEPTPDEDETLPIPQNEYLSCLTAAKDAAPEVLEAGVQEGVKLLDVLKSSMAEVNSEEMAEWVTDLEKLQKESKSTRTVVGVVGNTGAGKSSVINALLDEERLVPTNCMRACTAVVTEISWNDSEDLRHKYRAEIEFIKPEEWQQELETLHRDLLDSTGDVSRDCTNPDTEAGIAYAKIKAVYPHRTRETIATSTIESFMQEKEVKQVLGKIRRVNEELPNIFYKQLQHYVDSKEKTAAEKEKLKREKKSVREMEFWPLIKVVRIFCKSAALSTGAVIVDLPGVQDSNTARASVAQGYMKQCTGLWIVAPITRAVDDKAAKSLLGDQFKRQLKYDGQFSSVSFICSKTDDISITEAADSLNLGPKIQDDFDERKRLDAERLAAKKSMDKLREEKSVFEEIIERSDSQIETWEDLQNDCKDEDTVYAPTEKSNKRKHVGKTSKKPRKKRPNLESDDSDFIVSDDAESVGQSSDEDEAESETDRGDPLTMEQIEEKLGQLKQQKKSARRNKSELETQIREKKKLVGELRAEQDKVTAQMNAICISGRNKYSKGAIQQDFAAGIRELDQENAEEEDEENFNPEEELRDYDEVARSLPVFCVSSKAYQKLCGRLQKDSAVPGFQSAEETEIPQLQAHCRKLTEAGRVVTCRTFLNKLVQLLGSLGIWATTEGRSRLTDDERNDEAGFLKERLRDLEQGFEHAVTTCLKEIASVLTQEVYNKFELAESHATDAAIPTSEKWGAHRELGGLVWASYKAVCRRNGVFTNAKGTHDFNSQLTEPLQKYLASGWEATFVRRTPRVLQQFHKDCSALVRAFHNAIHVRAISSGVSLRGLHALSQQLSAWENAFHALSLDLNHSIQEKQKDASRQFVPVISNCMIQAYAVCVEESGPGSFKRMKSAMYAHVHGERSNMFSEATDNVKYHLDDMRKGVQDYMETRADQIYMAMQKDYMTVMGGQNLPKGYVMPKEERALRRQLISIIEASDDTFRKILEPDYQPENLVNGDAGSPNATAGAEDAEDAGSATPRQIDFHRGSPNPESPAVSAAEALPIPVHRMGIENGVLTPPEMNDDDFLQASIEYESADSVIDVRDEV